VTPTPPSPAPLGPADAAALALLHASAFPAAEAWGADAIGLMLGLEGGFGLGLAGQGFVLARAVAGEAEVLTLAVAPNARRQGVATGLLRAAMAVAAARQASVMFLEVAESNGAARQLYMAAGFAEVGRRRRYYSDGSDALVLSRRLGAA
jgi:ribosomal-protein-alanine N-acetyltransferase